MLIAVCDDEQEYRKLIIQHINFYFNEHCIKCECFEYENGKDLISSEKSFDIVFLDIEMDELNGIETAKQINKTNKKAVIFIVTAFQKYLDDAMDLNVFRYIDKPLNSQRLYNGLDKAIELINNNEISFRVRDNRIIKIRKSDIVCAEIIKRNVRITTVDTQYDTRENMEYFRQNLTASFFAVPHNSFIVNFNYVSEFKRDSMKLCNNQVVSIAPRKRTEISKKFMQFIGEDYGSLSNSI